MILAVAEIGFVKPPVELGEIGRQSKRGPRLEASDRVGRVWSRRTDDHVREDRGERHRPNLLRERTHEALGVATAASADSQPTCRNAGRERRLSVEGMTTRDSFDWKPLSASVAALVALLASLFLHLVRARQALGAWAALSAGACLLLLVCARPTRPGSAPWRFVGLAVAPSGVALARLFDVGLRRPQVFWVSVLILAPFVAPVAAQALARTPLAKTRLVWYALVAAALVALGLVRTPLRERLLVGTYLPEAGKEQVTDRLAIVHAPSGDLTLCEDDRCSVPLPGFRLHRGRTDAVEIRTVADAWIVTLWSSGCSRGAPPPIHLGFRQSDLTTFAPFGPLDGVGAEGPSGVGAVAVVFGALSALIATWVTVGFGRRVWRLRHALRARHVGGGAVVFGDHIAYADGLTSTGDVAVVLREVNRAPYRGATRVAVVALDAPERIRQRLRAALAWDLEACALVWLVAAAPAAVSAAFGFAL